MALPRTALVIVALTGLTACSGQGLRDLRSGGDGPDEFMILPSKPLVEPTSYSFLPDPTPGGSNRVDQNPMADAVAAFGGRPEALEPRGVAAADAALVASASRHGVQENIREVTAQEDEQFRKRRGRLTSIQLFPVDRYAQVYRPQQIDPYREEQRFRRAGVPTVTNPPQAR